jgi:hypothetical protein
MAQKEVPDRFGFDQNLLLSQPPTQCLVTRGGPLDLLHQDRNRFGRRRLPTGGLQRAAMLPLCAVNSHVRAVVDKPALRFLPPDPRVGSKSGKERTGVQPHQGSQFAGVKTRRRALDQRDDRLLQGAVLREEHPAPTPHPVAVKLRHIRQGVVSAVVVVAVGCPPLFQPAACGVDAAAYELGHLPQRHGLAPPECFPRLLRHRIKTPTHRHPPFSAQVYDIK